MKDTKDRIFTYLMSITFLFLCLLVSVKLFYKEPVEIDDSVVTSKIEYNDDITSIYVEYPRFKNDNINSIITSILYSYIKEFKESNENKVLDITYSLYFKDDFVNVMFHIENTLNNIKNKNILINLKENKISYITNLYNEEELRNEIYDLVYNKYSEDIYNKIKNESINNFTYIISEDQIDVYFNNIDFENIDYIPYVEIIINSKASTNDNTIQNKKYISFTYDDGPSEYTSDILKTLELNNSSATFFMIGSKMSDNEKTIIEIDGSNSEIGMHGYTHKDLNELSEDEILSELNTANIIFESITNKTINYLRPPYGRYNEYISNLGYKIILWNIDPKDWLVKDSNKIYNNVIQNACDGCIVLMHDTYKETLEATKKLLPALNEMGYEVVSISKLLTEKNYIDENNEAISYIK